MMQVGSAVTVTGQVTFGRDAAMFESLLGFVAELSVALWAVVLLTLVIRFIGVFMYRRGAARRASAGAVASSKTAPATVATSTFDGVRQPAGASSAVTASARAPHHRVPVFAVHSTEA
jgi:hypothetical protein